MSEEHIAEELPSSLAALLAEVEPEQKPEPDLPETIPESQPAEPDPVDPIVEKAAKGGWTDKDTWVAAGKDPDEWIDAKEFVSRKPLYEKLHAKDRALRDAQEKLEAVTKYAARAAAAEREKVLAEIAEQKKEAFAAGDHEAYEAALQREGEIAKSADPVPQQSAPVAPEIPPEVADFAKRNEMWFEKDRAMTTYAIEMAREYIEVKGMPRDEALRLAEADVKREFSHKFVNPNKDKPSAVASNNREARGKSYGYGDLNAEQRSVYAVLKKNMSLDEFISGLRAQGELK